MYEGDKGYNQPFKLTNAWNNYEVNADNLCFSARKPDNQLIEIEHEPTRFKLEDGIWYFKLPDELTQAVGQVKCYFYVKDDNNNIVASTTKFAYNVEAKFSEEEQSISYTSALERLQHIFEQYIENAKNEVNEMDSVSNEYKQKLLDLLAKLQKQVDDWVAAKTAEIDADIKSRQDALDKLNTDTQNKYNELVSTWTNQITVQNTQYIADKKDRDDTYTADKTNRDTAFTKEQSDRSSDWATQKQAIQDAADSQNNANQTRADNQYQAIQKQADTDKTNRDAAFNEAQAARATAFSEAQDARNTDYQTKLTAALKDITDQRDVKIAQIDQEWTEKKTALTTDIDTFKTNLLSQLTPIANSVDKLTNTDLPAMEAKADQVQAKVDQLTADIESVDFDSFAKKSDTYTKKEVEDLIDAGGKVKGATINGGEVISPNEAGILPLTVPDPDLSNYATKTEVNAKADQSSVDTLTTSVNNNTSSISNLTTVVNGKANSSDVTALQNTVSTKANQSDVDTNTANIASLTTTVNTKANQSDVDNLTTTVNGKANQSDVDNLTNSVNTNTTNISNLTTTVNSKADQSSLDTLNSTVSELSAKVDAGSKTFIPVTQAQYDQLSEEDKQNNWYAIIED